MEENEMYCLEDKKEFYELMRKKRGEIDFLKDSSKISDDEKDSLYGLVDKNIQEYETSKVNMATNSKFVRAWKQIGKGLQGIMGNGPTIQKSLPGLKKAVIKSRITKSLESQRPTDN